MNYFEQIYISMYKAPNGITITSHVYCHTSSVKLYIPDDILYILFRIIIAMRFREHEQIHIFMHAA